MMMPEENNARCHFEARWYGVVRLICYVITAVVLSEPAAAVEGWEPERPLRRTGFVAEYPERLTDVADAVGASAEKYSWSFISGSYRLNAGYTDADIIVTEANYGLQEPGWRYFYGPDRVNTFDPAIFNRLQIFLHSPPQKTVTLDAEIVVDPWSFIGVSDAVVLPTWYDDVNAFDPVVIQWRYWSNNRSTVGELVRSASGDTFALPELRVKNNRVPAVSVEGGFEPGTGWVHRIDVPELTIERRFKPMRMLEIGFSPAERLQTQVFLYKREYALPYSDDPLGLINRHITWEPSPWIDQWQPGRNFTATGWEPGFWRKEYLLRDSDSQYLTLARGVSAQWRQEELAVDYTLASPLDHWQDYQEYNAVPMALRAKHILSDALSLGVVYTSRWGFANQDVDAFDQAAGVDVAARLPLDLELSLQAARARAKRNMLTDSFLTVTNGDGYRAMLTAPFVMFDVPVQAMMSYAHLQRHFEPPLAHYRFTRDDQPWGNHILFTERSPTEEAFRIGDSIDSGRAVAAIDVTASDADIGRHRFSLRNVNSAHGGGFLENVVRYEVSAPIDEDLLLKFLARYHDRNAGPGGVNEDELTVGAGFQYDPWAWLSLQQSVERTNLYPDFPAAIYPWMNINPPAPYPYYTIAKTRLQWSPQLWLTVALENCYNGFYYTASYDDFMNYSGVDSRVVLTDAMTLRLVYRYSRVADYFQSGRVVGYHNVYSEMIYEISPAAKLRIQFSDLGNYVEGRGWQTSVLETRHLVRVVLSGTF